MCTSHAISEIQSDFYDQDEIDTGIHKSRYHRKNISCSIQIKYNRENITIVYNMFSYKLKDICWGGYTRVIPYQT